MASPSAPSLRSSHRHFQIKNLETNMEPIRAASKPHTPLEDPLDYLPFSDIAEYRKGDVIYSQNAPPTSVYQILEGRVKVSRLTESGHQVLVNLYQTNEFFGESAFAHLPQRPERAAALENTKLMTWAASEVEELVMRRPRLGIAFVQLLAQRTTECVRRIESFSADNIAQRLARCLISLSERMGTPQEDGSVRMIPFTHELLSEDIGTSREIVTQYMNQFRKQGYLQYSRKGIVLHRDAFHNWLQKA
jgi:CRP/FNR family cyclic AMP-dependent transcriptional regulator